MERLDRELVIDYVLPLRGYVLGTAKPHFSYINPGLRWNELCTNAYVLKLL